MSGNKHLTTKLNKILCKNGQAISVSAEHLSN
nr:MAG TPA: hypothetical protein [Caudoviricetes sp.]